MKQNVEGNRINGMKDKLEKGIKWMNRNKRKKNKLTKMKDKLKKESN